MDVMENIRKTMGWCPQVSNRTAGMLTPEVEIKNLGVSELKKRKKFCSEGIEIIAKVFENKDVIIYWLKK